MADAHGTAITQKKLAAFTWVSTLAFFGLLLLPEGTLPFRWYITAWVLLVLSDLVAIRRFGQPFRDSVTETWAKGIFFMLVLPLFLMVALFVFLWWTILFK